MLTSLLIVLPLVGALVVWAAPLPREATAALAVLVALAEVVLWVVTLVEFDFASPVLQNSAQHEWLGDLGVTYHVGFYGFSLWLAGLTVVVGAASIGFGAWVGRDRARAYYGLMLFLIGAVVGVFAAQDLLLFYVFFEAMLIPIYVLVGVWGGPNRVSATVTFVIYTMAGSLLMLASIVVFGLSQGTFSLIDSGTSGNEWVFLGFLIAFAVKAPLLPFHGWLRTAYTEAPPEVAALLSGVVSKAAVYGLIWIVIRHFPGPVASWRTVVLVLAAAGLVYGSVIAFRQPDVRGVVAYSSMGQMSLIVLGIFSADNLGLTGAILHSVSHGLVSAAMFLLAAMLIQRTGTDRFADLGGLAKGRPALATIVLVVGMLTLAVPGSANFAGEFAILAGVFTQGWGYAAVGAVAIVLAAMYTLRLISGVLHLGRGDSVREESLDLRVGELVLVVPLVAILLALSVWPSAVTEHTFPGLCTRLLRVGGAVIVAASIATPKIDWLALSPGLALLAAAAICLLGAVLVPARGRRIFSATIAGAGFVTAGVLAAVVFDHSPHQQLLIAESMSRDRLAALAQVLVAGFGLAAVLVSFGDRRRDHVGEYYALLAAAGGGMAFFVSAGNLMTLFLGLEWFSISLYILVALDTHRKESLEAGLKYLIVGSFGSAILLFGSALTYGATGELGFNAIRTATGADDSLFVAGMAMIIAGLAFKASAAPFHMWTPDVYEGAPTPVTAFMSAATKAVALVVTLRLLVTAFPEQAEIWSIAIAVLAVVSLVIGNFAALAQKSVKRLLAYSSVSQAGFMLIAIAADNELGGKALLFYLIPYGAASIGAFAVVAARERELGREVTLASLAGWGWERPFYGAAMWVFMLSFAGFPFTGGMIGKFYVFSSAEQAGWWWLIVIGVVATAVSVYYYLAVVRSMYMRPAAAPADLVVAGGSPPHDLALELAIGAAVAVTVGSFFFVQPLIELATKAVFSLPLS